MRAVPEDNEDTYDEYDDDDAQHPWRLYVPPTADSNHRWHMGSVLKELVVNPQSEAERLVGLWKKDEDLSAKPVGSELEGPEEQQLARRQQQLQNSTSEVMTGMLSELGSVQLRAMAAQLAIEVATWRTRERRREEVRSFLLTHRFNPNCGADQRRLHHDDGHSPLHDAVCEGNEAMTQLLLEEGVTVNQMTKNDMTPLDLAEWYLTRQVPSGAIEKPEFWEWRSALERTACLLRRHGARNSVRREYRRDPPPPPSEVSDLSTIATLNDLQ
eukprot:gnl/MRDRNA2_/MRDRNA2_40349_c0_seq1.p1 gnl/MRDRNA2_/MRDRNA2_40349_c0~~gnl/MRDRNA2_/MRDRNA2_40349_c0_seq1.p1  ORF type:complete len:271 (-),score=57.00 gnl/MRDRNA2_/MRDRNA2_40349_c0_seq1:48-860(-)